MFFSICYHRLSFAVFLHKACGKWNHLQTHYEYITLNTTLLTATVSKIYYVQWIWFLRSRHIYMYSFKIIQIIFNNSTRINFFRRKYFAYWKEFIPYLLYWEATTCKQMFYIYNDKIKFHCHIMHSLYDQVDLHVWI